MACYPHTPTGTPRRQFIDATSAEAARLPSGRAVYWRSTEALSVDWTGSRGLAKTQTKRSFSRLRERRFVRRTAGRRVRWHLGGCVLRRRPAAHDSPTLSQRQEGVRVGRTG